jgi:hypothetical protein
LDLTGAFDLVPNAVGKSFVPLPGYAADDGVHGFHMVRDPAWTY